MSSVSAVRQLRMLSGALAALLVPGCFVSFDGYSLGRESGGAPGSGAGGDLAAGGASGSTRGGTAQTGGTAPTGGIGQTGGTAPTGGIGQTGGAGTGGNAIGGTTTGGTSSGGNAIGGTTTGGMNTGGSAVGGRTTGGAPTGGRATGGTSTGGSAVGGRATGGTSSGGSATGGTGPACPFGLPGPVMTQVPKASGGYYCIDRTEVTNAQYAEFLQAGTSIKPPAFCGFNTSYVPQTSADCTTLRYDPVALPRYPVGCVDWCDAYAFCAWANKRLCGDLAGGAVAPGSFADLAHDQWYVACTGGGTRSYPYGNSYQRTSCVGVDYAAIYPVEVASAPACQGGYPDIFDLSGNVSEWEDACYGTTGAADACVHRGGSLLNWNASTPSLRCDSANENNLANVTPALLARQARSTMVGFRCCWDPS